jgi:hypothetical protein
MLFDGVYLCVCGLHYQRNSLNAQKSITKRTIMEMRFSAADTCL